MKTLRSFALSLALPCALVAPAAAQGVGTVGGVVFDSTRAEPLEGARVLLWGTSHEATSDAQGRFAIAGVPAGGYAAVFFHPRLTELGVASGSLPVSVPSSGTVRVELALPSLVTLAGFACVGAGGMAAVGLVHDGTSGVPLSGVPVTFRWLDGGEPRTRSVESGAGGLYQACALPSATTVAVESAFFDRRAPRREVRGPEGAITRLDLALGALRPSDVIARVQEAGSGAPVPGAVVSLGVSGNAPSATTDASGRAAFEGVPPGRYTFRVEHLAHAPRTDTLDVPEGSRVAVALDVTPGAIPLAPIEVTVARIERASDHMGGIEITRAQIDAVRDRSRDVADLLQAQNIPSVIVKRDYSGDICIEFTQGQARMFKRPCYPVMVILDGVRLNAHNSAFAMPAGVVESMRLFRPVDAGNLFGLGAGSGVLVVTTKSHP